MSEPTAETIAANEAVRMDLPLQDESDFEDARRGFVAALTPAVVRNTRGRVVWDMDSYAFLDGECPDTVNPSLWRQSQLNAIHGLFEVVPGIYQVRGLDLSNMTIVEGERGVLVIDPLISAETAAAALGLYRSHRGERPVTGLLYTHSHIDHFGGAPGVISAEEAQRTGIPIIAPAGFLEHAVSENVHAGPAMTRRAAYMYGSLLECGPRGQVGAGLGMTTSTGTVGLLAPTREIEHTGQRETVDGIEMIFQLTPGTEAPVEMNFLLAGQRALCIAENATHNLHNVITLRGAQVRDAKAWARYLDEAIELFADRADVIFAQHHWPRWGEERILELLSTQRDLYAYLHDQTLRMINAGQTGAEIAEQLSLPPALQRAWHCRGYYGSVSHNVRGIYQRYMGFFDGNPAHLFAHPPEAAAKRYVQAIGGPEEVLRQGRRAFEEGDYRWVAELMGHAVFADPQDHAARELQAQALDQLGYGAENATWRNFFLTGARELREGVISGGAVVQPGILAHLSTEQLFEAMAVAFDGPRAGDRRIAINFEFTDRGERHLLSLGNGVLWHRPGRHAPDADATVSLARSALEQVLSGSAELPLLLADGRAVLEGDLSRVAELLGLLVAPDPQFGIVTP